MEVVTFTCTKEDFAGSFDSRVTEFDAWENYDLLNEFFGAHDASLMCSKEEYFDGFDTSTWTDYVIIEDGAIVSRAAIWKRSDDVWEVAGVSTRPDRRSEGYGAAVVKSCIAKIVENDKTAACTTRPNNIAMINTALQAGFIRNQHI